MPIQIHENTIHEDLIEPFKKECRKVDNYVTRQLKSLKDGKYRTFWFDKNDEPKTFIEYLAKSISLQDFPNGFPDNYAGFEWWVQVRGDKENITFHYDKDEGLCTKENKYIYPLKSTITYLTDIGGPTAIFKNGKNNFPLYNHGYLSFPKINKHLVFDGHLFHGVIGPLSKIDTKKGSERITFLINYWHQKPIEPNCIHWPNKLKLLPLTKEQIQLQDSVQKEKSKLIQMNYKNGYINTTIYRNSTPIPIKLAKNLKAERTYIFDSSTIKDGFVFCNTHSY